MKKVLFVIPKLCNGGAERRVALLANELSKYNDLKVSLLSFWETDDDYALSKSVKRLHLWKRYRINHHLNDKKRIINMFFLLFFKKFDVIFTMHPPVSFMVKVATPFKKKKVVDLIEVAPNHMKDLERRKKGWAYCSKIVSQCNKQIQYMPDEFKSKCVTITNPVDDKFFNQQHIYSKKIRKFINVGRLDEEKNQILLLDAFKIIENRYPDVSLTIYGKGPMKETLLNYKKEQEINNVEFIDRSNDMPETYNEYDSFILTSNFEGMPNALIEAMAVGLPCISTNCDTGPSDLITSEVNGILVEMNKVDELVKAIVNFCDNADYANKMGIKGKEFILLNHKKEIILKKYHQLICEMK